MPKVTQQDMVEFIWDLSLRTPIPALELYKLGCGPQTLFGWAPVLPCAGLGIPMGLSIP